MKHTLIILFCFTLFGCQTSSGDIVASPIPQDSTSTDTVSALINDLTDTNSLTGMYVGYFESSKINDEKKASYSNKINIVIESIADGQISGQSVVAGNLRPFTGSIDENNYAVVSEPGDDKYDGVFQFTCYPAEDYIEGIWVANDPKLAVSERKFNLKRTTFEYNPDAVIAESTGDENNEYPYAHLVENQYDIGLDVEAITWDAVRLNASNTILKKDDIENLYKSDLEIIRNTMYARHGYSFKNRKMRYFFDVYVDWYVPVSIDIRNELTEIEKKNEDLLKRYEEHAESYYDYFGR